MSVPASEHSGYNPFRYADMTYDSAVKFEMGGEV
jgi:hypothetical protein